LWSEGSVFLHADFLLSRRGSPRDNHGGLAILARTSRPCAGGGAKGASTKDRDAGPDLVTATERLDWLKANGPTPSNDAGCPSIVAWDSDSGWTSTTGPLSPSRRLRVGDFVGEAEKEDPLDSLLASAGFKIPWLFRFASSKRFLASRCH
jgi:hypothetical protein